MAKITFIPELIFTMNRYITFGIELFSALGTFERFDVCVSQAVKSHVT